MEKLRERVAGVRAFFADVVGETRKSAWPGRQELIESTVVVIVSVVVLGFFVGICDKLLVFVLGVLVRRG